MANRCFKISTKTELFTNTSLPAHLIYDSENPDHAEMDESNPFFSAVPTGQQLTFDGGGLPDGLEARPAQTVSNQACIDLVAAGVTVQTIAQARYLDTRGDSSLLDAINISVDAVVISSGLSVKAVSELI